MSAFITTKTLVDSLLQRAIVKKIYLFGNRRYDLSNPADLDKVGQILVNANYKSVNTRYNEKNKPYKYHFQPVSNDKITSTQIIKSCECFDYQACEYKGWSKSEAYKILNQIYHHTARDICQDLGKWESDEWDF